jgi:hypothetical protein
MNSTTEVNTIIDALKAIIKSALCQGFNPTSYLVTNHIRYIKSIQSANNPKRYIYYTAKKLFPTDENGKAIAKKFEYIRERYHGDLLQRFEELYTLYQNIIQENKDTIVKKPISNIEADKILEDLLTNQDIM